jgi:hypothetical protein
MRLEMDRFSNSVTPDKRSRIMRAVNLIRKIESSKMDGTHFESAEKLGINDRLGVTAAEVKANYYLN